MAKKETLTVQQNFEEIVDFIAAGNQARAIEYVIQARASFWDLPDLVDHKQASELLPKSVREMPVKGFAGYTLRIMRHSDGVTYLLSAHRPGLTDSMKNRQTNAALTEM